MRQITQKLKSGQIKVIEVPIPAVQDGCLLVKNHYSLVSSGTEGSAVKAARKGYIGKAKEKPEQVKQVFDMLKVQGPSQTYRTVMKKLDSHSSLGYSCTGEVIDVASGISSCTIGDLVACGGVGYASHAEIVNVPVNLCVKLQQNALHLLSL